MTPGRRAPNIAIAIALAAALATPTLAQDATERARIDDFALPADAGAVEVDQIGGTARAVEPAPQRSDRSLTVAAPPPQGDAPLAQVGTAEGASPTSQLTDRSASRQAASAVSSTGDSRPQGVVRIGGVDRCDPQLDAARRAECLRILELRAEEFNAPRAPQLSAEQRILAEERARDEMFAKQSAETRLRFATMPDPDADLSSNQELASIFLDKPAPATAAPAEAEPTADPAATDLGTALLNALGIPVPDPGQ